MKNIIENLANIFETTPETVLAKLNLNSNFDAKDLAKALGVYSLYPTKEDHGKYIAEKLANKEQIIADNAKVIDELNNQIASEESAKQQLKNLINTEWKKLGIKRDFDKEQINLNNLDFSNIQKSLIEYAESEGLAYGKPNFNNFIKNNNEINNEEIDAISINGAVKK